MVAIIDVTLTLTSGSPNATVTSGPALSDANCSPGSLIEIGERAYFVLARTGTTTFTLTRNWANANGSYAAEISPVTDSTTNLVQLANVIANLTAQLNIYDKNSQGLLFEYVSPNTGDPGTGGLTFNSGTFASITNIYFSDTDGNGLPVPDLIETFQDGTILIVRSIDTAAYVAVTITNLTAGSGFHSAVATPIDHGDVLAVGEPLAMSWYRNGDDLHIDASGNFAGRSAHDGEAAGFTYLSSNGNGSSNLIPSLYRKNSATSGDWGPQIVFQGPQGYAGWAPILAVVSDGARRVLQLTGWTGGEGTAPTTTGYLATGGIVATAALANDIAGATGAKGDSTGRRLTFSTLTTGNPASGAVRLDSATAGSVALMRISKTDAAGSSLLALLRKSDDALNAVARSQFQFQGQLNIDLGFTLNVTGAITENTNDVDVPVTLTAGAIPTNGTSLAMTLSISGADGTNGVDGFVAGSRWTFDTTTTASDPGSGKFRASSGTFASITELYIDNLDVAGIDQTSKLDKWDDVVNAFSHGTLRFTKTTDTTVYMEFEVTGSVVDSTGYRTVTLTPVDGAVPANGTVMVANFYRAGKDGNGTVSAGVSSTDSAVALWDGTDANVLKDGVLTLADIFGLRSSVSATTSIDATYNRKLVTVDASGTARTMSLLAAATAGDGFRVGFKKSDSSVNIVLLDPNGSETIDGFLAYWLLTKNQTVWIRSNGTNWEVVHEAVKGSVGSNGGIGCTLSNNVADATNDIDITAGRWRDSTDTLDIVLPAAITKRLDGGIFVAGTNQPGSDTSSALSNTTYHVWVILRSDTGVVDVLFSASATSPTMPANYDYKRRIGSILRESAANVAFVQRGDKFVRSVGVLDVTANNPGTSAVLASLSIPTGLMLDAVFSTSLTDGGASISATILFTDPAQPDTTVTLTSPFTLRNIASGATLAADSSAQVICTTNTSGQVRYRLRNSDADINVTISTTGWIDTRGRI